MIAGLKMLVRPVPSVLRRALLGRWMQCSEKPLQQTEEPVLPNNSIEGSSRQILSDRFPIGGMTHMGLGARVHGVISPAILSLPFVVEPLLTQ